MRSVGMSRRPVIWKLNLILIRSNADGLDTKEASEIPTKLAEGNVLNWSFFQCEMERAELDLFLRPLSSVLCPYCCLPSAPARSKHALPETNSSPCLPKSRDQKSNIKYKIIIIIKFRYLFYNIKYKENTKLY